MGCGNSPTQISFTTTYLGLADSIDSSYAGKAGWMVTVNPSGTGTILAAMPAIPDVTQLLTNNSASTTYATINTVTAISGNVTSLLTSVATLQGQVTTNAAAIAALAAGAYTGPSFYRNGTAVPPSSGSFKKGDYFIANQT